MSTSTTDTRELFRQAIRAFQSVLEVGVDIHERSTECFAQVLNGLGSAKRLQQRSVATMENAVAVSEEDLENAIQLMNSNATASLELLHKAFNGRSSELPPDGQAKMRELWDMVLGALRTDVHVVVDANARALRSWANVVEFLGDRCPEEQD